MLFNCNREMINMTCNRKDHLIVKSIQTHCENFTRVFTQPCTCGGSFPLTCFRLKWPKKPPAVYRSASNHLFHSAQQQCRSACSQSLLLDQHNSRSLLQYTEYKVPTGDNIFQIQDSFRAENEVRGEGRLRAPI